MKAGRQRITETETVGEEVKGGNGFSNLKGISCYIRDVQRGRMGRAGRRELRDGQISSIILRSLCWQKKKRKKTLASICRC